MASGYDMIAVGTSAGGFNAICRLIKLLPPEFEIPIAIVQHRAKESEALAGLMQNCTTLKVYDVEDKQPVERGSVYIAPPDYHMLIDEGEFTLSVDAQVAHSRPSIDVFFDSVADAYGPRAIGVVLTGANADGSKGLQKIVSRGGQALVQDPAEAEVSVMPAAAKQAVKRARVMTIEGIAAHLQMLQELGQPKAAS